MCKQSEVAYETNFVGAFYLAELYAESIGNLWIEVYDD